MRSTKPIAKRKRRCETGRKQSSKVSNPKVIELSCVCGAAEGEKKDFDRSEQLLEDAARFLQRACQILEEDGDYDEQIDAARKQLRTATIAVRGRSADARQKIEQAVTETDRVVSALEGDEDKAAEQTQDPAASCEKLKTNRNYQEPAPQ